MGIIKKGLGINVLEASRERIKNIFSNGLKVYLNVSGGKDSIVMSSLVYDLIREGEIDPKQLEVAFIDEEFIYDDVVRICKDWRMKFMLEGVTYHWYTVEHRNNNCFNALENNESFIPWDRYEQKNWARPKPTFAESTSPYLSPRTDNYQDFLRKSQRDGITIIGVRASESQNRNYYLAKVNSMGGITNDGIMYPIYDWKDADIWKYIKDKNLDFPDVYFRMWEAGTPRSKLRISNLFAIDSCNNLVHMFEVYPDLWEKILKREPNAYLVRLYWDTEMFRRETKRRKELEDGINTDYKSKFIEVINHPNKYFKNKHALGMAKQYRNLYLTKGQYFTDKHFKKAYAGLMGGDTKGRTLRALTTEVMSDSLKDMKGDKGYGWVTK